MAAMQSPMSSSLRALIGLVCILCYATLTRLYILIFSIATLIIDRFLYTYELSCRKDKLVSFAELVLSAALI